MTPLENAAEKLRLALLEANEAERLHANAHREKNNMIANLRADLADRDRVIEQLRATLRDREALIARHLCCSVDHEPCALDSESVCPRCYELLLAKVRL